MPQATPCALAILHASERTSDFHLRACPLERVIRITVKSSDGTVHDGKFYTYDHVRDLDAWICAYDPGPTQAHASQTRGSGCMRTMHFLSMPRPFGDIAFFGVERLRPNESQTNYS